MSLVKSHDYKNGKKAWKLDCRIEGVRLRKFFSNMSKKQAEIEARKAIMEFKEKKNKSKGIGMTLDELSQIFLEHVKSYKRSWKRDDLSIRIFTSTKVNGKRFGSYLLEHIDIQLVGKYRLERKKQYDERYEDRGIPEEKRRFASINRELACLKYMFTLAVDWGYSEKNPVKSKTIQFFREQPRTRYLLEEEIPLLLNETDGSIKDIVLIALNTGMRTSEILTLCWNNVDMTKKRITLQKTKNDDPRVIPINNVVYKVFSGRKRNSKWIFLNSKTGKHLTTIRKGFGNALKRAGIKDFHFHDLRHTFTTYLTMAGIDEITRAEILGHRKYTQTSRYSHSTWEKKIQAVKVMEKYGQFMVNVGQQQESGGVDNNNNIIPLSAAES